MKKKQKRKNDCELTRNIHTNHNINKNNSQEFIHTMGMPWVLHEASNCMTSSFISVGLTAMITVE